jgi:hypothetical protein
MAYGTLNAGTITPGSGNTLTINETVTHTGAVTLPSPVITGTPTGITAAHLEAGVLPSDVTGGAGLTAIAGVTTGSGDVTIANGNLVIGTAGKGIDFSATANGGVSTPSELLDDYEEGTWTPTNVNGLDGVSSGTYTKIGNMVHVTGYVKNDGSGDSSATFGGLPFPEAAGTAQSGGAAGYQDKDTTVTWNLMVTPGTSNFVFYAGSTAKTFSGTTRAWFSVSYSV